MKITPKRSARQDALFCLNKREYGFLELIQKLTEKGHPKTDAAIVAEEMREKDFQNDRRYAKFLVNSKAAQKQSPSKIKAIARQKGIDPDLCDEFISDIDFRTPIKQSVLRKFGPGPHDFKQKSKIYRFLMGRGYDFGTCQEIVGTLSDESEAGLE